MLLFSIVKKYRLLLLYYHTAIILLDFPGYTVVKKKSTWQWKRYRRCGFDLWVKEIPLSRKWQVKVKLKVSQLCLTLCSPVNYTVHGILQARILEWVAFPFSRGSSQPRDQTQVSHIADTFFTSGATRDVQVEWKSILEWVASPFSSRSSWPRNWTEISCIAGCFFTHWANREP